LRQITVFPMVIWRCLVLDPGPEHSGFLIGQIYTIGLEFMFYLVAPFVVLRSLPVLAGVFLVSLALHFAPLWLGAPARPWQYEFFPTILVFFLAGALAYRLYVFLNGRMVGQWRRLGWTVVPLVVGYGFYFDDGTIYTNDPWVFALYAGLALAVPFLFIASSKSKLDQLLGDLSYPFYLVHGLAANLLGGAMFSPVTPVIPAYVLSIALSFSLVYGIERPVDLFRKLVRAGRWRAASHDLVETPAYSSLQLSSVGRFGSSMDTKDTKLARPYTTRQTERPRL
jgi:peptidoglycan/LPS O-acetylase OafA/YrhL